MTQQTRRFTFVSGWALPLALTLAGPVQAHHPMGGATPGNWVEGLLSGIGHPVIGLDHLAFVVAFGLLAGFCRAGRAWLPPLFVSSTLVGTLVHLAELSIPFAEALVAVSVLTVGYLLVIRKPVSMPLLAGFAAVAGVLHGYAFGEAVVGAETTPVLAYLAGLSLIQTALAGVAFLGGAYLERHRENAARRIKAIAGGSVGALGTLLLGLRLLS